MSFIHCIEIFQRGYKEGSDRVRKGKAIRTLSEPYLNPIRTLSEPYLNSE